MSRSAQCETCKKDFSYRKRGTRVQKYCSIVCCGKAKVATPITTKGIPHPWAIGNKYAVGNTPWNKGKNTWTADKNPNWKSGRYVSTQGYIMVLQPAHPRANGRGYVLEHVLVACEKLGRIVLAKERVHHIDGDKWNNDPENLIVFGSNKEHVAHHDKERPRDGQGKFV